MIFLWYRKVYSSGVQVNAVPLRKLYLPADRQVKLLPNPPQEEKAIFLILNCIFTFFILNFTFLCGCQNQKLYIDKRIMMGTTIEVTSPSKEAAGIVFNELQRIENLLSKYKPDSEVSGLNRKGNLKASPETFYVLKKSKEFWEATGGAFDITAGVLVDLWGFTDKKYLRPPEEKIKQALNLVGSDKIILQERDNVVKFMLSGMKIDLGGIAKGFALDCAVKKLKEHNIGSCLINAGGQVYCLGDKFGKPWKIAINSPRGRGLSGYLELKDKSVATSGDYEQYFIKEGKRYAHILNPKTGYPADTGIMSVTVVADDGLTADALSTAVFVLGEKQGREQAAKFAGAQIKNIVKKER